MAGTTAHKSLNPLIHESITPLLHHSITLFCIFHLVPAALQCHKSKPLMNKVFSRKFATLALVQFAALSALAWDYENHRVVNQLALASLPTNFPGFVRAPEAAGRVAFLSGE